MDFSKYPDYLSEQIKKIREYPLKDLWGAPAFRIIDDIYFVGDRGVSSHLITSEEGHILIDTCWPSTGPYILKSIIDLGYNPEDVEYILISHAHIDHLGSTKFIAEETGAKICVGRDDAEAVEKGSTTVEEVERGSPFRLGLVGFETFKVDVSLGEGDIIAVGDKKVHVYHTPGHTPGCCSFGLQVEDKKREYEAFLFGGSGVNVFMDKNIKNRMYGGTILDFKKTLDRMEDFKVDVWLGGHPFHNNMFQKLELMRKNVEPNPFIDPQGWKNFIKQAKLELLDSDEWKRNVGKQTRIE